LKIYLSHPPIPLKRPRFKKLLDKTITYDPQKQQKVETLIEIAAENPHIRDLKPLQGDIYCSATFGIGLPISWPQKRKKQQLHKWCSKRPDIDNYLKFYLDVLNQVVYDDDSQIVWVEMKKFYVLEPFVELKFEEVQDGVDALHHMCKNS